MRVSPYLIGDTYGRTIRALPLPGSQVMTPDRWPTHLRLLAPPPVLPAALVERSRVIPFPSKSRRPDGAAILSHEGLLERVMTVGELGQEAPLSVVAVRLAGLSVLQERRGWTACEGVVQAVSTELRTLVRATDSVGRINAGTFGVVLQGCGATAACAVAARLTYRLNRLPEIIHAIRVDVSAATGTGVNADVLVEAALEPFDDDAV